MQGVDLSASDYDKRTPLHVAACEGDLTMLKFLVNVAKVDITTLDRWGRSALDDARFFAHKDCVQFLEKALSKPEGQRSHSVSSADTEEDASTNDGEDSISQPTFTVNPLENK
ncbi:unnamed protein product [Strongylus vulgaris]|uniref:Uncharacterized protein n=1 Tax=Strongylus vulgaris TaxID=40348 RepID=A0A3P7KBX3_STRVU|nr:unnamed protein product [Strongylus vulgaris]